MLKPITFNTSGFYKCEVSTDGPNFETVVKNGTMSVIGKCPKINSRFKNVLLRKLLVRVYLEICNPI